MRLGLKGAVAHNANGMTAAERASASLFSYNLISSAQQSKRAYAAPTKGLYVVWHVEEERQNIMVMGEQSMYSENNRL